MTTDHEIERVLDRWLSEGPTLPAAGFLADTMDRIDHAPRRRLVGPRTRLPAIHPGIRTAAAVVIAVAAMGLAASVFMQVGGVGGRPAGSGPLPASLQAEWSPAGTPREYAFLHGTTERFPDLDIIISQSTITIFEPHTDVLNSALLVGVDRFELRALNLGAYSTCHVGDVGTYVFSLSQGDRTLTLTPVGDACAERAAVLTGDWTRTGIGNLTQGRHVSAHFGPFFGSESGGSLSFTVPSGWADIDISEPFSVVPRSNPNEQADIRLWTDAVPESQDAACAMTQPGPERTPATVAAWLATIPGLAVTPPTTVRIGSLDGVMVDVSVVPGWTSRCAPGQSQGAAKASGSDRGDSFVSTFILGGGYPHHPLLTVAGERRVRYLLLDRGEAQLLVIDIEAPDSAFNAAMVDAMTIVQSFEFTR